MHVDHRSGIGNQLDSGATRGDCINPAHQTLVGDDRHAMAKTRIRTLIDENITDKWIRVPADYGCCHVLVIWSATSKIQQGIQNLGFTDALLKLNHLGWQLGHLGFQLSVPLLQPGDIFWYGDHVMDSQIAAGQPGFYRNNRIEGEPEKGSEVTAQCEE